MADLIPYAEKLALDPPVKVFKELMKMMSAEQLIDLDKSKPSSIEKKALEYWTISRQQAEQLVTKYEQTVKDYGDQGVGVANFSVTATCDFVAMCMMMIGAGAKRVEALKQVILGQKNAGSFATSNTDRAYLFKGQGAARDFQTQLDKWCDLKGNGIVQFKFPAGGDLHTFAVERAPGPNDKPEFVVYQGYQNTYSLAHFLRLRSLWKDDALDRFHESIWKAEVKTGHTRYKEYKGEHGYWAKVWLPQLENVERAVKRIGSEQRLDRNALARDVLTPIATMLSGTLPNANYINLTGSPTSSNISSEYVMVLMCDQVEPQTFAANHAELDRGPDGLTKYPTL